MAIIRVHYLKKRIITYIYMLFLEKGVEIMNQI